MRVSGRKGDVRARETAARASATMRCGCGGVWRLCEGWSWEFWVRTSRKAMATSLCWCEGRPCGVAARMTLSARSPAVKNTSAHSPPFYACKCAADWTNYGRLADGCGAMGAPYDPAPGLKASSDAPSPSWKSSVSAASTSWNDDDGTDSTDWRAERTKSTAGAGDTRAALRKRAPSSSRAAPTCSSGQGNAPVSRPSRIRELRNKESL